jgi:glutathione S-transferase
MRNPEDQYPLPEKKLADGGWDSVLFAEGLQYVTQQPQYREAIKRFRRFLAEGMKWSEEEIKDFLDSRADCWPPLIRRVQWNEPIAIEDPYMRLPQEPTWRDYGGFYLDELPTLKAVYTRWFQAQASKKRLESLPHKKEKRPAAKKVA